MSGFRFVRLLAGLKRVLPAAGGLVGLVVTIAWLSGMFEAKVEPGWEEVGTRRYAGEPTDVVHEVTRPFIEEAVGTLKASSRTEVSSKVLATIERIHVTAGDQVTKDQVLIELDSREFQARLDQAKQMLQAAIATRQQAEKEFERHRQLIEQNAVSPAQFDRVTRNLHVAKADEQKSRQAVSEAEAMLSYTVIRAVRNGRIVDRFAEPGDVARPGNPILVLYDAASLRLEAPVMEHLAVRLKPGDTLQVHIDALNRDFSATIDEIVPQADAPSRSFLVKAGLPRSDDLYEGMFGRLRIPAGDRRHLCLTEQAIVQIGQLEFVDVVLPDGIVERRLVRTGRVGVPGRREVLSGLEAGDQVVLSEMSDSAEVSSGVP